MLREIAKALKARPAATLVFALIFAAAGVLIGAVIDWNATIAKPALSCAGEYADTLQPQYAPGRAPVPTQPAEYTYLVRNTARYECPYYGTDGKLRKRSIDAREHGTAFAYEVAGEETFLLTNEHVAVWPEVTDSRNKVPGVSDGCKRVESRLRIVHDEQSEEEVGQIPIKLVAADPRLDAAILKASRRLTVIPYAIGKSQALRQGNAVEVRGFPLGLLHAVNTGKVVNPYDVDVEQGWDHVDFVIDALLSEGNSGSPVLALSCKTGKLELVGVHHAGYKEASALNVVVGIDQLREFMSKKKRIPRASSEGSSPGVADRRRLEERLSDGALPIFAFGGLTVLAERSQDGLRYHFYGRGFPVDDRRLAIIEDRPAADRFGDVTRLYAHGDGGWRELAPDTLGDDERDLVGRMSDALRIHMLRVLEHRRLVGTGTTADDRRRAREYARTLERQSTPERELGANFLDLIERIAPTREGIPLVGQTGRDGGPPPPPTLVAEPLPTTL
jgi:Trypsin-like peptidase domain